jgi:diguanylate cyclase (GGDEF)-like protein/putative nucleotidyltransferase with HDIG domain
MVLSAITVASAARGIGPFVKDTPTDSLLSAQGFIIVTALTTLLLAAITEDRRRAGAALRRSEDAKRALAAEQAALRRVAEEAARATRAEPVLELAAAELAKLLRSDTAAVVRYLSADRVRVMGEHGRRARPGAAGTVRSLVPGGAVDLARRGRVMRSVLRGGEAAGGLAHRVAAPITVEGRVWGAVIAATADAADVPPGTESLLARFADILSLAVAEADARERLRSQATSDPLTGLLKHRAFHERLREEVAGARRHGRPLSIAIFDIDHFKAVNDAFGHAQGDLVLAEATRRLIEASRAEEPVGRLGGDELAVIMPATDGVAARHAADRMRRAIGEADFKGVGAVTVSAGTCDLAEAGSAEELLRLADGALYWAKAHGRDSCFRYSPDVVAELSATERAERLARGQALSGVRALARAIDAKDPSTIRHSERVAELVGLMAERLGWEPARVALLREAGLVHDVGKIGVPDAVLFKRGPLDASQRAQVERHAALGAQIASEVLEPEQAAWIRAHHERHDGSGYPDGLREDAIPEGAQLLALADAWDAMTRARPYSTPMTADAAWAECRRQAGRQFAPAAVRILGELMAEGLTGDDAATSAGWDAAVA